MPIRQKIATIHLAGTIWFVICVSFLLVIALLQAGVKWWIVFSLSVHGILFALLLISLYLFAIYRGISSSQKLYEEHPITKTDQYAFFYAATPFFGSFAGFLGTFGADTVNQFLSGIALGTFGMTFIVWVIVDPALGFLEMFFPESRKHYIKRQTEAKIVKEKKQQERKRLLSEIMLKDNSSQQLLHEKLKPHAEKLALLLSSNINDFEQAEREAAGIGIDAWQMGGLTCMRELRDMALEIYKQNNNNEEVVDYITFWWDGIGNWRETSLC